MMRHVIRITLPVLLLALLLCACGQETDELQFPEEFPQISFESYPLGAPAAQAAAELGCADDTLDLLARDGSVLADISPEAYAARGGTVYLKGVPVDHISLLFRGEVFESVSYFFYIRQFPDADAFFSAVVAWHAALSNVLTQAGYTEESLKLSSLRSAADFEENTRQATFWNNGQYQLEMTLSGVGDSICCKVLLRTAPEASGS